MVSGRLINGYCGTDWLLRFLYRTSSGSLKIAGLMPVDWKDRRMFNFDLSDIVTGELHFKIYLISIIEIYILVYFYSFASMCLLWKCIKFDTWQF